MLASSVIAMVLQFCLFPTTLASIPHWPRRLQRLARKAPQTLPLLIGNILPRSCSHWWHHFSPTLQILFRLAVASRIASSRQSLVHLRYR